MFMVKNCICKALYGCFEIGVHDNAKWCSSWQCISISRGNREFEIKLTRRVGNLLIRFAGLASSKCYRGSSYRPCSYCGYRGPSFSNLLVCCSIFSLLHGMLIWFLLNVGHHNSMAENVWIQYPVGPWNGPCWNSNTG